MTAKLLEESNELTVFITSYPFFLEEQGTSLNQKLLPTKVAMTFVLLKWRSGLGPHLMCRLSSVLHNWSLTAPQNTFSMNTFPRHAKCDLLGLRIAPFRKFLYTAQTSSLIPNLYIQSANSTFHSTHETS